MRLFLGFAFLLLTALPGAPVRAADCAAVHSIVDYPPYGELLCSGWKKIAVGLPGEALKDFEAAARIDIHEVPNFEIFTYLAHAQLLLGDDEAYRESITKSKLALFVWTGIYQCNHANAQVRLLDAVGLPIETVEAAAVAARMCGDIYTAYYEPGARTMASTATDGKLAAYHLRVRALFDQREAMAGTDR